jgi:hypothetical protein
MDKRKSEVAWVFTQKFKFKSNSNQRVRAEKITIRGNWTTRALSHKITPRTHLNGSSAYEVECLPFSQGLHVNNSVWEVNLSHAPPTSLSLSGIWLDDAEKRKDVSRDSRDLLQFFFSPSVAVPTTERSRSRCSSGIRARKKHVQVRCPTPILRNFANGSRINIPSQPVQTRKFLASLWHLTPHPIFCL